MSNPVPEQHLQAFIDALIRHDREELSDGVWWSMLEDAASEFMQKYRIAGSPTAAVHQYLDATEAPQHHEP